MKDLLIPHLKIFIAFIGYQFIYIVTINTHDYRNINIKINDFYEFLIQLYIKQLTPLTGYQFIHQHIYIACFFG